MRQWNVKIGTLSFNGFISKWWMENLWSADSLMSRTVFLSRWQGKRKMEKLYEPTTREQTRIFLSQVLPNKIY